MAGALFTGHSHEGGRNAIVVLYADRLERTKARAFISLSSAAQDVEVTPISAVSSVQTRKAGLMYTAVTVYAIGNNIEFKFGHAEAAAFKAELMKLVLQRQLPLTGPGPTDIADQLGKLAALREQGVLTEEEFAGQKARLLA